MSVADRVRTLVTEQLGVGKSGALTPETTFVSLGADSLDRLALTLAAEQEFGVAIPDATADTILTVGQLETYLAAHGAV